MVKAVPDMPPLLRRKAAVDAAKFRFEGKPFKWGENDCARLAGVVLKGMGYKTAIASYGAYKSAATAYRRLREKGCEDVHDWLDSIHGLERTPFAFALLGDILAMPGDGDRLGLAIHLGGDKMLAFANEGDHPCAVIIRSFEPLICWKADPCLS